MAIDARHASGPYVPFALEFSATEPNATTALDRVGAAGGSALPPAPYPGWIHAISVGSETAAALQIGVQINGTTDSDTLTAISGTEGYATFESDACTFAAGDNIGAATGTATTTKDVHVVVYGFYDVGAL